MRFSRHSRTRQVVVTAFTEDRRILQQWHLDLTIGQRIPIPEGARTVQVDDPETITRTRVVLGQRRRRSQAAPRRPE
jgi:hypothetical protein